MFFKMPPSPAIKKLPAAVQPHLQTIINFVALFPEGEMQKEIRDLVSSIIDSLEETELPLVLQLAPAKSLQIFFELCRAMEAVGNYYK